MSAHHRDGRQRGAALLTALLIVVLVSTLAAAMLWRQARSIQVGSAERAASQADWVLLGALDWARLILREDTRANQKEAVDHLGEVWAVPLAEARLSSFLSTDSNHSADAGPDAFLSGHIEDAQSRYNLRNLVQTKTEAADAQLRIAARLFESAGLSGSLAKQVQDSLQKLNADSTVQGDTPLPPVRLEQLQWLGLSAEQVERLRPLVVLLPVATPVNLNTAPREVIAALYDGMDLSSADRMIRGRAANPMKTWTAAKQYLPQTAVEDPNKAGYTTNYFYVEGQLRLDDRLLAQRSLVWRESLASIKVLDRQRIQRLSTSPTNRPG